MIVTDVNGDGIPDVLFLGYEQQEEYEVPPDGNHLFSAIEKGDGTFKSVTDEFQLANTNTSFVTYADVNGDGKIDMIGFAPGTVTVYPGPGFDQNAQPVVAGNPASQQPQPADFDGSGHTEVVEVDGTLSNAGLFLGAPGIVDATAIPQVGVGNNLNPENALVTSGDLNGDGIPDVIVTNFVQSFMTNQSITYFGVNDGKGNFSYPYSVAGSGNGGNYIAFFSPLLVDFTGDGLADPIIGWLSSNDPIMLVSVKQPSPSELGYTYKTIPMGDSTSFCGGDLLFTAGDLNGDGFQDLVVTGVNACSASSSSPGPSGFFVLMNDGKGNFTPTFTAYGHDLMQARLIDFNGDGKLDLAITDVDPTSDTYNVSILPGNGNGTFNVADAVVPLDHAMIADIIPGDFNGDGKQDLTLSVATKVDSSGSPIAGSSGIELLQGNGNFTFEPPVTYTPGLYATDGKYADFSGDGRLDLALAMTSNDGLSTSDFVYMVNLGGGQFGPPVQTLTVANSGGPLFVGDYNSDGALDVMVDPGAIAIFYNDVLPSNSGSTYTFASANLSSPARRLLAARRRP